MVINGTNSSRSRLNESSYLLNWAFTQTVHKKILNKENEFSQKLLSAKKPIVIIGESALEINSGKYIFEEIKSFLKKSVKIGPKVS